MDEIRNLIGMLQSAVDKAYNEDRPFFKYQDDDRSGLEQAFVFRVGIHMHELLKKTDFYCYDLDSEYRKNHGDIKSTERFPDGVRPDLIIHKRDTHEENKMVIEFKGWWDTGNIKKDWEKLEDLTNNSGGYRYLIGVSVMLGKEKPSYEYFYDGKLNKGIMCS